MSQQGLELQELYQVMLEPAKSAADMLKPAAWAACGTSTASGQTLLQPVGACTAAAQLSH